MKFERLSLAQQHNKSLDARRFTYFHHARLAAVGIVSRPRQFGVRCFVFKNTKHGGFENQENTLRVFAKVVRS